jgi:hypothetical protein
MRQITPTALLLFAIAIVFVATLSGCAAHYTSATVADPYGFWSGVWHGFIAPLSIAGVILSWLASLFGIELLTDVAIIGRPNSGFDFYYVGFVLGFLSSSGGGAATTKR